MHGVKSRLARASNSTSSAVSLLKGSTVLRAFSLDRTVFEVAVGLALCLRADFAYNVAPQGIQSVLWRPGPTQLDLVCNLCTVYLASRSISVEGCSMVFRGTVDCL